MSGKLDSAALQNSLYELGHRGPDSRGIFEDKASGVGLAHTRLAIQDLSPLGNQPFASPDGRQVVVFNGEIYNFRELRSDLEASGYRFTGGSDTEVLLNLYRFHRNDSDLLARMLRRMNGVFAFAIWDSVSDCVVLARDALGVKPLYYTVGESSVAFASEIKALLPLVPGGLSLDHASIARYMTYLWCPGDGTPAREIRKVGPGEALWLRAGRVERRTTWYRLPVFVHQGTCLDRDAAVVGLVDQVRMAVHRQLVADVPVGAFLSGGLDSSSVVAFAKERDPGIKCFTIELRGGTDDGAVDDLPYARKVAAHLGVHLEVVSVDAKRMMDDLQFMVGQLDEPLADPAPLNVFYISRLARENGIKVLLSGAGGDDLFTGYRRHTAVAAQPLWQWLPVEARRALSRLSVKLPLRWPMARRARKLFDDADLSGDARLVNYFSWFRRAELELLYTDDFRAAVDGVALAEPMLTFLESLPGSISDLQKTLALDQRFFLSDHNLIYTDKMAMAAGVEVRVPFLDLDLIDFAARIADEHKQRGLTGKWVLKKAMEPFLPREVVYRPKSGFGAPLRRWMRFELKELLSDVLSVRSLRSRGLFEPVAVERLRVANERGEVDASYTMFSLLCIELWCRRFIDRSGTTGEVLRG